MFRPLIISPTGFVCVYTVIFGAKMNPSGIAKWRCTPGDVLLVTGVHWIPSSISEVMIYDHHIAVN